MKYRRETTKIGKKWHKKREREIGARGREGLGRERRGGEGENKNENERKQEDI